MFALVPKEGATLGQPNFSLQGPHSLSGCFSPPLFPYAEHLQSFSDTPSSLGQIRSGFCQTGAFSNITVPNFTNGAGGHLSKKPIPASLYFVVKLNNHSTFQRIVLDHHSTQNLNPVGPPPPPTKMPGRQTRKVHVSFSTPSLSQAVWQCLGCRALKCPIVPTCWQQALLRCSSGCHIQA